MIMPLEVVNQLTVFVDTVSDSPLPGTLPTVPVLTVVGVSWSTIVVLARLLKQQYDRQQKRLDALEEKIEKAG